MGSASQDKTPRRTVISQRGRLAWSSEDADSLGEDIGQASTPKKMRLSRMNSQEEMTVQIKNENREGQKQDPHVRQGHIWNVKVWGFCD